MKSLFNKITTFALIAVASASVSAADLGDFGIESISPLSEAQASNVRGAGYASSESTAMTAMQVFIFDSAGGSSINLSSSSINSSSEYGNSSSDLGAEGSFVASATQSVSSISALDIAFGEFTLHTSEFALGAWGDSAASGAEILFDAFE
jgi:hypothetical protein